MPLLSADGIRCLLRSPGFPSRALLRYADTEFHEHGHVVSELSQLEPVSWIALWRQEEGSELVCQRTQRHHHGPSSSRLVHQTRNSTCSSGQEGGSGHRTAHGGVSHRRPEPTPQLLVRQTRAIQPTEHGTGKRIRQPGRREPGGHTRGQSDNRARTGT